MFFALTKIRPRSLRGKLLVWYSLIFGLSAIGVAVIAYAFAAHQLNAEAGKFLADEAEEFERQVSTRMPDVKDLRAYLQLELGEKRHFAPFYLVTDNAGNVLLAMPQSLAKSVAAQSSKPASLAEYRKLLVRSNPQEPQKHYVVKTSRLDVRGQRLILQCGYQEDRLKERLSILRSYLAISILAILLVSLAGGKLLAKQVVKPLDIMLDRLREIRSGALNLRLPSGESEDELGSLTNAVNSMLDEIEAAFGQIQAFTADVAHELRTPLTSLRCELEVAVARKRSAEEYREVLASALEGTQKLGRVVENLLFLTRARSSEEVPGCGRVDLSSLLCDVVESFELAAEGGGIVLRVDIAANLETNGNAEWLRILFGNLVDNALKFTPSEGEVIIIAEEDDQEIVVSVRDTGVGIPSEAMSRIFDRFYRVDKSRSRETGGSGLGLSIAKRIVDLHGGRISVESRAEKGTTFQARLPKL